MSLLRAVQNERFVLVCLGVAVAACVAVQRLTCAVLHEDTEIQTRLTPEIRYITQENEDSLKPTTLNKLLNHHNFAIRECAAKIIYDRGLNDRAVVKILLGGIASADYDVRLKSLRALADITDTVSLPLLHRRATYRAFVQSLSYCCTDGPLLPMNDRYWDDYPLRDLAEKFCLVFVKQLVTFHGASKLVQAGFVEEWLGKQDWGTCFEERNLNFCAYQLKHNKIVDICQAVVNAKKGKAALQAARLLPSDEQVAAAQRDGVSKMALVNIRSTSTGWITRQNSFTANEAVPRVTEQSPEEIRLRHRHREAMVLNDGTTPLGRRDIIERETEDVERDSEEMVAEPLSTSEW